MMAEIINCSAITDVKLLVENLTKTSWRSLTPTPLLYAGFYILLWLVGLLGCLRVLSACAACAWRSHRKQQRVVAGTVVYVVALCLVDLVTSSTVLSLLANVLFSGAPLFGAGVCPPQIGVEWFGKVTSTPLLTALSFERFAAVHIPHRRALLEWRFAVGLVTLIGLFGCLQLLPVLLHSQMLWTSATAPDIVCNATVQRITVTAYMRQKCLLNPDGWHLPSFNLYISWLFVVMFLTPVALTFLFHRLMVSGLRRRFGDRHAFRLLNARAVRSSQLIVLFYVMCVLPQWVVVVWLLVFAEKVHTGVNEHIVELWHALPLFNSSINWVFYTALNTQLTNSLIRTNDSVSYAATASMVLRRVTSALLTSGRLSIRGADDERRTPVACRRTTDARDGHQHLLLPGAPMANYAATPGPQDGATSMRVTRSITHLRPLTSSRPSVDDRFEDIVPV